MLTDSQRGMLFHHIETDIFILAEYVKKNPEVSFNLVEFIRDALNTANHEHNDKKYYGIERSKQNLRNIFSPTFEAMSKLAIINSVRDLEEIVTYDTFPSKIEEIRTCAFDMLIKSIRRYPEFAEQQKGLSNLKESWLNEKSASIPNRPF